MTDKVYTCSECFLFCFLSSVVDQYYLQNWIWRALSGLGYTGGQYSHWMAGGAREQDVHASPSKSWRGIKCCSHFVLTSWLQKADTAPDARSILAAEVTSRLGSEWCHRTVKSLASYSRGLCLQEQIVNITWCGRQCGLTGLYKHTIHVLLSDSQPLLSYVM